MDFSDPKTLQALATVVGTVFAFIALVAALVYQARRVSTATRTLESQQAAHTSTGIVNFVLSEYLDRDFRYGEPLLMDGKDVRMRDLKHRAKGDRRSNPEKWASDSTVSTQPRPWENRLVYELAIALERMGIAVFTGVVRADAFLALAADQVLDDWMLCSDWVDSYRKLESARDSQVLTDFHRRHAEWLFLLSAIWKKRSFPKYPPLAEACRNRGPLKKDFLRLTRLESKLMPDWVRSDVATITGFAVP